MSGVKVIKKGEYLFKEGDPISTLIFIQSGRVSILLPRPKANIELQILSSNSILGELALVGVHRYTYSALAVSETKYIEVPVDALLTSIETWPQLQKMMMKGMGEKVKVLSNELKASKMEKNALPCPTEQIPKIFATLCQVAFMKGSKAKDSDIMTVEWRLFKQFAQRVFMESPGRLDQVLNLLTKLNMAKFEMVKSEEDPEAPEEIGPVQIFDIKRIELFYEFYQHYYYKGASGADIIKVNETCLHLVEGLLKLSEKEEADRKGNVRIDFNAAVATFQKEFGVNLSPENVGVLEQKGLFVKRSVLEGGAAQLSFDRREFDQMFTNWRILKEIDLWNQKGFVDMTKEEDKKAAAPTDGSECPDCHQKNAAGFKFCGHCGHKMAA